MYLHLNPLQHYNVLAILQQMLSHPGAAQGRGQGAAPLALPGGGRGQPPVFIREKQIKKAGPPSRKALPSLSKNPVLGLQ